MPDRAEPERTPRTALGLTGRHRQQPGGPTETFKLSKDPLFIEKVRDIVGLYLHPPDRALVLCVDEKSQIQALSVLPS